MLEKRSWTTETRETEAKMVVAKVWKEMAESDISEDCCWADGMVTMVISNILYSIVCTIEKKYSDHWRYIYITYSIQGYTCKEWQVAAGIVIKL